IDALRLHERVEEEQGAGAVTAYLLTTLEQLVIAHVIRSVLALKKTLLSEILFIKDGPLAFFGVVAPMRKPMQELCDHLDGTNGAPLLRMVGVEKSGAFVEHAIALEKNLPKGVVLP
ncbi:MAG: NurA domain-containing protein, partial [Actinobacteria bacterium]|nr:NurA domain-containing protein [Actinomycetota bacterium]